MCGQLSILSSYFFLYLDYWAGDSVRATASQPCDQMRRGSADHYLRISLLGYVPVRELAALQ